jgi:hypothetical protein
MVNHVFAAPVRLMGDEEPFTPVALVVTSTGALMVFFTIRV